MTVDSVVLGIVLEQLKCIGKVTFVAGLVLFLICLVSLVVEFCVLFLILFQFLVIVLFCCSCYCVFVLLWL